MIRTIHAAIQRIKSEVAHWLEPQTIRSLCQSLGHVWRERILDPVTTIHLFALQILHGNTACAHVPRLGGVLCTGEAYCQARSRLPLTLFQRLLPALLETLRGSFFDDGRWHGHRTFLLDGSGLSMPDTVELQEEYGQPGEQAPGCGFPVMHMLAMFHAATGFLLRVATAPLRTHDLSQIGRVHPELGPQDVLVGDRGFCSFAHLALLAARQVFGLFRTHQKQIVDFHPHRRAAGKSHKGPSGRPTSRWLKRLGRHDQLVEYIKPKDGPVWLTEQEYAALPDMVIVRELRYTIEVPGRRTRLITLTTTLLDPEKYPAAELADLYGQRWQIETHFRHLKQTMNMDVLHCQSVAGVQREVAMYALVYNLVRLVMVEAARRQEVPVHRISFVDAVRWLSAAISGNPPLELRITPLRPGRLEPRAVKRRPKEYDRLNQPRDVLRQRLRDQVET
jgi:DDE family transposase